MIIAIIFLLLVIFTALYISMIMPRATDQPDMKDILTDYAHRGLFDKNAPENSIAAFRRAVEKGLILINAGANIVRFVPPLVISKENVDEMIDILDSCIRS